MNRGEDYIAAGDTGFDLPGTLGDAHPLFWLRHRQIARAADIRSAKQGDLFRHLVFFSPFVVVIRPEREGWGVRVVKLSTNSRKARSKASGCSQKRRVAGHEELNRKSYKPSASTALARISAYRARRRGLCRAIAMSGPVQRKDGEAILHPLGEQIVVARALAGGMEAEDHQPRAVLPYGDGRAGRLDVVDLR